MATGARSTTNTSSQPQLPQPSFDIIPTDGSTLQEIDRVAAQQLRSDDDSSPRSLQGRVTPPSTPRPARISRFFDLQTSSDDNEVGDADSQRSNQSSPGFTTSSDSLNKSGFYTPSPRKAVSKKTPSSEEAVKSLSTIIDDHHPGYDLSPRSHTTFQGALRKVNQWKSPHKPKEQVRAFFRDALVQTGSTTEVPSPSVVGRRLVFSTHNLDDIDSQWTTDLAKSLRFSILDAKHLKDLENNGGFHICGADHPRDCSVILRRTNLLTGVWCGRVCKEGSLNEIRKKFSSFVPRQMKLEHYQFLIAQAINTPGCKIAQQDNRRLYRVVDGKNSFVIECYFQEEGTRIRSAIPVFHLEVYNGKDKSFIIEYSSKWSLSEKDPLICTSHEVFYDQLFDLLRTCPDAVVYETDDKIIVDVGVLYNTEHPKYGTCPIDQGLLVEISKKLL